jgi:hypothetical protein
MGSSAVTSNGSRPFIEAEFGQDSGPISFVNGQQFFEGAEQPAEKGRMPPSRSR